MERGREDTGEQLGKNDSTPVDEAQLLVGSMQNQEEIKSVKTLVW